MSVIYKQFDSLLEERIKLTREHIKNTQTFRTDLVKILRESAAFVAVNYEDEQLIATALLNSLLEEPK